MKRRLIHTLSAVLLGAGLAGCANQPKANGVFWWPQGPGTTAEDLRSATSSLASNITPAGSLPLTRSSAQSAGGEVQPLRQGDLLFVSGQIASISGAEEAVGDGLEGQVRRALENAMRVIESHGLGSTDIVSVTLYTRDIDDLQRANAAYAAYFPRTLPARAVVGVDTLPAGSLVEIAVIARK
jgi:2-iminobutanoate/2-iminopropanoate deaminase